MVLEYYNGLCWRYSHILLRFNLICNDKYKKNKVKKPISGKTLLAALQNYYKDNANLAEEITKHVMDNREEQIKETIKRKIEK